MLPKKTQFADARRKAKTAKQASERGAEKRTQFVDQYDIGFSLALNEAINLLCKMRPAQNKLAVDASLFGLVGLVALGTISMGIEQRMKMHLVLQSYQSVNAFVNAQATQRMANMFGLHLVHGFRKVPEEKVVDHVRMALEGRGDSLLKRAFKKKKNNILVWDAGFLEELELAVNLYDYGREIIWQPAFVVTVLSNPSSYYKGSLSVTPEMKRLNFAKKRKPVMACFECIASACFFSKEGLLVPWNAIGRFLNRTAGPDAGERRIAALKKVYENLPDTTEIPFVDKL